MSRRVYLIGHCGIYTRLTLKLTTLLMSGYDFKTQPGPVAKNATLGLQGGNRSRYLANLVRHSVN